MNETCFGRRKGAECAILEAGVCRGQYASCPFYNPRWKVEQERRLALQRIATLPREQRAYISEKYFQGRTPWEENL